MQLRYLNGICFSGRCSDRSGMMRADGRLLAVINDLHMGPAGMRAANGIRPRFPLD
jgi:hypothetical protein